MILHIPHSPRMIPAELRDQFVLSDAELAAELGRRGRLERCGYDGRQLIGRELDRVGLHAAGRFRLIHEF